MVWAAHDLPQYVPFAMREGAAGFVLETSPTRELVAAIRTAAAGGLHFGRRPDAAQDALLSACESRVVEHVVESRGNDEIAARMGIGTRAVEAQLARLYQRLAVQMRTGLAVRAVREGWLDLPASG